MAEHCPKCGAPEVEAATARTVYACTSSDHDQRTGTFVAKCERYCMYCLLPGGTGKRELRPYGPDGKDVCAGCVFDGPPERLTEADRQMAARFLTSEPLLLDNREQVGPRPLRSRGDA